MRRIAPVVALAVTIAACGGGSGANTTPATATTTTTAGTTTTESEVPETTTPPAPETTTAPDDSSGARFAITEVSFGSIAKVVITNVGSEAGSLGGHWLCQAPSYHELPDVELAPGQSAAISGGGDIFEPPAGAIAIEDPAKIGSLNASGGEVALFLGADFADPDDIVSYVEWGNAGHQRSVAAVGAGIWPEGGFVETTEDTGAILATLIPATEPDHWTSG